MVSASLDALFGPKLRGKFDFTLLFEHSMIWIVPTGLLILVTPFYFKGMVHTQPQVRPGTLLGAKMVCSFALIGIQAVNIALWRNTDYYRSDTTVAACSMALVASFCTAAIIAITHLYSIQPSTFLGAFLSITMIFDITMARSYFLRDNIGTIAVLQIFVVVLKFLLIILEEVPKRALYRSRHLQSTVSAETASGFWNRSLFLWLNPLLFFGWRHNFTSDNLPAIDDAFAAEKLFDLFVPVWAKVSKSSKFSLISALIRVLSLQLAKALLPRLLFIGCVIAQPFLLLRTLELVGSGSTDGYISDGLIGACAFIYLGIATTRTLFQHWEYRAVTLIRGILMIAIYDKMLRLPTESLESSAAVTLMSADIDGTEQIVSLAYEAFTFIGSLIVGKSITSARAATSAETQTRVAATSNILAQIKSVKGMGLTKSLIAYIERTRDTEINTAMRERHAVLWIFGFSAINYTVTPALVLSGAYFWTRADDGMTVAEIFTILAILGLCTSPLISLFRSVTLWGQGLAAIGRIYEYLVQEELRDDRELPELAEERQEDEKALPATQKNEVAIELEDVSVTSPTDGPILQKVNIRVPWGDLVIAWGPICSGKSTLLKTILGEAELNSGTLAVGSRTMAYCSQVTWVPNCSFRETIIGEIEFDDTRYRNVIRACALDVDLAALPDGDKTKTGSGGCNLSGGQRQRLGLARGAYAEEEIMIVDDAFSSVDPDTAYTIFDRLFGSNGLVRRWNCTVVMTTNRLELLDHANQVYQLTKEGKVTKQSNDDQGSSVGSSDSSDEDANDGLNGSNRARAVKFTRNRKDADAPEVVGAAASSEPETAGKAGDLSLYTYLLKPAGYPAIFGWLVFIMITAMTEWSPVLFLRIWYAKAPDNPRYFIGYVLFSVLHVVLNVSSGAFYFGFVFKKITKAAHNKLLYAALGATPQYYRDTDAGSVLNRFSQNISLITRRVSLLVNQFFFLTCTTIVEIAVISAGSVYSMPVMICIFILLGVTQFYYLRSSRQLRQIELESSATLFKHFTETTDGIMHVRGFGWAYAFRRRLFRAVDQSQKPRYLLFCIQRWLTVSLDIITAVVSISLISASTKAPADTSSAAVGLAMLGLMGFSDTATLYIQTWTSFETAMGAVRRVRQFVMSTPQETDEENTAARPQPDDTWPTTGRIDFNALTATYRTKDGKEHKALDNATFTIQPGQKVGIVGRTGSGKSTLLSAVLRMVDYTGSISIDGHNTRFVPRELLRSKITTITQDGLRLKASLRFNLYPFEGKRPSDADMIDALRIVDIWAHAQRNGGLDAEYSKLRFSTGQKQLMFLARGILHQASTGNKIVLIDEVTSSMTTDAEPELQRLIDISFNGCTIVLVSHRKESSDSADRIFRFKHGRLDGILRLRSNGELVEVDN